MANCKKGSTTATDGEVRRSYVASINAINGVTATLKVVNDASGNWQNADASKAYYAILPVIPGLTEEQCYKYALTQYDLLSENIPSFPKDEVVFFTPNDALHAKARELFREGVKLSDWLNGIVQALPTVRLVALPYSAHNRNGGTWQAAILGAEKI